MQIEEYGASEKLLTISGFGAYRLLEQEAGLHVLEATADDEGSRVTARIRVAAAPLGDVPNAGAATVLRSAIDKAAVSNAVVRRYRGGASPLVRDGKRGWRSGKFESILDGNFDLIGATAAR
jgi:ATP-dependent Clp protease ATP-binding subunit ClpC